MAKVEIFNIEDKKQAQRVSEMAMSPSERLQLCLDLMDLHSSLRSPQQKRFQAPENNIDWIELPLK